MNSEAESEKLQNFQERLSQWVSSQGFWFQLRYSFSGGGIKGAMSFHLLRLGVRLLVFLVIAALGSWYYLIKESTRPAFSQGISLAIKEKIHAEGIALDGLLREHGEFYIGRMAASGGEDTFFTEMDIRSLKCRMGLLDRFKKQWDPGNISISRLHLDLRAGADSSEAAESMADVLMQKAGHMKLDTIIVNDANVRWGYSERTRGSIEGSKMWAQRLPNGWKLKFRGGTFSQNWLKRIEIVELDVAFSREGVVIEKGLFSKNAGYVSLLDMKVKAGERPEVTGRMNLRKVDIASLVPLGVRNFVEGTISGDFRVFGSTNSTDGLGFEGEVELAGEDIITIRDRVHLLRALSVVDTFNNYRRVDFREGSLRMKTQGGRMEVRDARLIAGDIFAMQGGMNVRLPTEEEKRILGGTSPGVEEEGILNEDELNITLERAARSSAGETKEGLASAGDASLFDRLGLSLESRRLEDKAAGLLARSYRYEGAFTISLPKDVFARAPQLQQKYPGVGANGRVMMEVPLEGVIYDLTLKQANEIYEKGGR